MTDRTCNCTCGKVGCYSVVGPSHGTKTRYDLGCRCDPCNHERLRSDRVTRQHRRDVVGEPPRQGKQWTGWEMEFALRDDIPITEIALLLGRSYKAVEIMRTKCRTEPKYIKAAGVSTPTG